MNEPRQHGGIHWTGQANDHAMRKLDDTLQRRTRERTRLSHAQRNESVRGGGGCFNLTLADAIFLQPVLKGGEGKVFLFTKGFLGQAGGPPFRGEIFLDAGEYFLGAREAHGCRGHGFLLCSHFLLFCFVLFPYRQGYAACLAGQIAIGRHFTHIFFSPRKGRGVSNRFNNSFSSK
jgi:hypothetical protein